MDRCRWPYWQLHRSHNIDYRSSGSMYFSILFDNKCLYSRRMDRRLFCGRCLVPLLELCARGLIRQHSIHQQSRNEEL
ncbi:hypothetical protein BC939DRAFT_216827 [Gamsiella multidivaricata]|uniref:uncharacterized protein n=1 Tax=Gamsiella multidivaricata TaxID=101098 RepID=UPI00221F84C3|nr:uncharacterized protein BC939DRAFT_216827 [Gamsiella multidivaricata]KAI7821015.1 hypothetical protein BC939DRAFT_216827 [Gamsiella multidivaricata]